jgi:hypothetical protein
MRTMLVLAVLALLCLPAVAGDRCCPDGAAPLDGCPCTNSCPLAQQANQHRALGREAQATSAYLQKDLTAAVERVLAGL